MRRVSDSLVALIGCGAVGAHAMLAMLATGFKNFILIDFDKVEARNCARGAGLFTPSDLGRHKTEAMADRIYEWDSQASVKIYNIDSRLLGRLFFSGVDAVICGLDNLESVYALGRSLAVTGVPVFRAATQGLNGSVEAIRNLREGGACLCCSRREISAKRAQCGTQYLQDLASGHTPSLPLATAVASNRLVMELTRCIEYGLDHDFRYYDTGRELYKFKLEQAHDCPWHGGRVFMAGYHLDIFNITLDNLFRNYPDCACIAPVSEFIISGWCVRCQSEYPVYKPVIHLRAENMHCPRCESMNEPDQPFRIIREFTPDSPRELLDMTLFSLGL